MTITIRNEAKDTTFELSVTNEPIMNLKMKIEESQGIEFAKQSLLYNGKPINEDGSTEQLIGLGIV